MMKLKVNGHTLDLRRQERLILLALLGRPVMWYDDLVEILWPHPDDQPDCWANLITECIYRIRYQLKKHGSDLKIVCRWKKGYMVV